MNDAELRNKLIDLRNYIDQKIEQAKDQHNFESAARVKCIRQKLTEDFRLVFEAIEDESWGSDTKATYCAECDGLVKSHHDVVRVQVGTRVKVVHDRDYCKQNLRQRRDEMSK